MVKYKKWLAKNKFDFTNKTALIVGGTGTIGVKTIEYLLYLNADVIIAARNLKKANNIKDKLLSQFPNANISILELDVSSKKSIDKFLLNINNYPKIDIFINNAGVYHLNSTLSVDGYEIHFATNALGNYYISNKIVNNLNDSASMVIVGSIAYKYVNVDLNDVEGIKIASKFKKYANTKRILTANVCKLKRKYSNYNINLVHPGICATELFQKANSNILLKLAYPFMKLIFISPAKAALSLIAGIEMKTKINEWIGPRVFSVWGYPKKSKLHKRVINEKFENNLEFIMEDMLNF